ncbi:MAG TPA: Rieske (2Fe-2S) protein [Actinomycetes bacterium]|nr:Rieske (2Fe-2S) protein [Actinomycetes bacterium]
MEKSTHEPVERRTVLRGVAVGGVVVAGGALVAACGSDDGDEGGSAASPEPSDTPTSSGGSGNGGNGGGGSSADVLVATADVPEGGGVILSEQEAVVTQPTAGDFACFTSICTHQGCEVGEVADGTINCPCHGSQYSIEDGSVVTGPATAPLAAIDIKVQGDSVVRA